MLRGDLYRYAGTNMWYAACPGSDGNFEGGRERLQRQLGMPVMLEEFGLPRDGSEYAAISCAD
jgi:hypothetical protein